MELVVGDVEGKFVVGGPYGIQVVIDHGRLLHLTDADSSLHVRIRDAEAPIPVDEIVRPDDLQVHGAPPLAGPHDRGPGRLGLLRAAPLALEDRGYFGLDAALWCLLATQTPQ